MPRPRIPNNAALGLVRATQEVALAALLGGNLFGRLAMHPALEDVSDSSERGRVLNRAWRRYGTVNSLALAALVAGWLPGGLRESSSRSLTPRERRLVAAKDAAIGAVVVTGLASAAGGVEFAQQAPGGAVPMSSGRDPGPETPPRAARLKRVINALAALNLFAELGLVGINASLSQTNTRSASGRRRPALARWRSLRGSR